MIKIENLSKDWKEFKINDVSLEINENEYFILLGPSGSGKTMLLELIAGMWSPDSGKIYINDENVTYLPPEKRGVGFVYQNYMLFPHKTVFDNIAFGLKIRKFKKELIKKNVDEIMTLFGISHLTDRLPRTLSGGEQQRTALARALIINPKVLLMDEPLSALDRITRGELIKEFKKIHNEFEITIIHVTHNFDEALQLADRVAIIKKGRVSQVGTTDDVFRHPKDEFTADFVGSENILKGIASGSKDSLTKVDTGKIIIESTEVETGSVHATIRPEDITLSKRMITTSARNEFKGRITQIYDLGQVIKLTVDVGEHLVLVLTRQSFLDLELNIGKEVYVSFKATAVNLF
jgi:molybdate/tungstate transport system ATP-binding protein